ncbi:hypothetical protein BIW11_09710, partial [Tropilaelaps mercedesae]
ISLNESTTRSRLQLARCGFCSPAEQRQFSFPYPLLQTLPEGISKNCYRHTHRIRDHGNNWFCREACAHPGQQHHYKTVSAI